MDYTQITEIQLTDLIPIYRDNCVVFITYEDFIKNQTTGGFNVCEAIQNCFESGNCFEDTSQPPINNAPLFTDLSVNINSYQDYIVIRKADILANYFDFEGDEFGKAVVVGGNLQGVTYNGSALYAGQTLFQNEDYELKIARVNNTGYAQDILIDVYDVNNVKAV